MEYNPFSLRAIWRGSLMVAGGLMLFVVISYAALALFWGGVHLLYPTPITAQRVYQTAGKVDSTIYFNPKTNVVIRRTVGK